MTQINVLERMVAQTPTTLWCDSCDPNEIAESQSWGAIGATSNPPIILTNTMTHKEQWAARAIEIAKSAPEATELDIAWRLVAEESCMSARLLEKSFESTSGADGRMAIQVDPNKHRDTAYMVDQAVDLSKLAPNIIVKIPATADGIAAIEDATYRGVTTLATVSYTVPQALSAAEAVERGLRRRENEGPEIESIHPKCAIMVGRLDDWLKAVAARKDLIVDPGCLEWAGVAVFKRAYALYMERGYRTRLLSAAFRNHMHWSEFIGGRVTISPQYAWQLKYIASDVTIENRIERPIPPHHLEALTMHFEDFCRAYEPDGMAPEEFVDFGATRHTLRQFLGSITNLGLFVRDAIMPDLS